MTCVVDSPFQVSMKELRSDRRQVELSTYVYLPTSTYLPTYINRPTNIYLPTYTNLCQSTIIYLPISTGLVSVLLKQQFRPGFVFENIRRHKRMVLTKRPNVQKWNQMFLHKTFSFSLTLFHVSLSFRGSLFRFLQLNFQRSHPPLAIKVKQFIGLDCFLLQSKGYLLETYMLLVEVVLGRVYKKW